MARIPAVAEQDAGVLGRLAYRFARRRFGAMPEPIAVTRHHPKLFWAGLVTETAFEKAATVLPAASASSRSTGRAGVVELTQAIGMENMRARANHALGITEQGFDAACRVRAG
jgi:alkylhydroperoxidase family enzyme